MDIIFVAAIGQNGELGKDNQLLWYLPGDLPRFKQLTIGAPIIMGRKTYDSIGKPLPGRTNIVLTANREWHADGVIVCHSVAECLQAAASEQPEKISVIGGGEIYRLFLPYATHLEITYVYDAPEADAFFPNFSEDEFQTIAGSKMHEQQPKFDYVSYKRK